MKHELICIVCPMGCALSVETEGDKIISVSGNTCKRGEAYAKTEFTDPRRTITSTVKTKDGFIVPVKTDKTVPKDKIFECMQEINRLHPDSGANLEVGSVICKNILNTGANIITTAPVRR